MALTGAMPKKRIAKKKAKQDVSETAFSVLQRVIEKTEGEAPLAPPLPTKQVTKE